MPTIILDKKWTHPVTGVDKYPGTEITIRRGSDLLKEILDKGVGHLQGDEPSKEGPKPPETPKKTLSRKSKSTSKSKTKSEDNE